MGSSIDLSSPEYQKVQVRNQNCYAQSKIRELLSYSPSLVRSVNDTERIIISRKNTEEKQNNEVPQKEKNIIGQEIKKFIPHKSIF